MKNESSCQELLGPLSEYISGEAAESLCMQINAHLAECENCRVVLNTVRQTILLYRATASAELPDEVSDRLYRVLDIADYMVRP
ncbi:MAG: zf-HC2 domain-containing protein [Ardenticatenales bacterium]|nr:zf-HC2 domain-containing protein [Ardenticatenales bacterium]